ncbi:SpoIVB peptidase [Lacrimispora sp. 210928-DFI.3.58]|uniref:SpoIVB peptidase n=1 Tax=Lacrimispora sp. 210928-DFI.3.58 TaxID=2883214 RepID=UPI0015B46729|nr:SpoIVB peptidase [Lacrimispora sp. 210928-DFI.3.58]MCB7317240.1 SpoIVB peptidase [Lacrimispora sp. 210928-DFI.3.58]
MTEKTKFYRWLGRLFWLSVIAVTGYTWYYMDHVVPDRISIIENQAEEFSFGLPVKATISSESQEVSLGNESNIPADQITITSGQSFSMFAGNQGSYQVGLKLFGIIKLKDIQVDVVDTRYAIPCGSPIGIYLKSDGVMVIGTGRITGADGMEREPAYGKLKSGDYIEALNGTPMNTKEDLMDAVNRVGGKEEAVLTVRREGESIDVSVEPIKSSDGQYKLGAWVRDDTQGIGTITYVDMNGRFGALGHGISDSDTGELVETAQGSLYTTQIMGIEKGTIGKPGLLSGVIYYGPQSHMGDVTQNTNEGIFGTVNQQFMKDLPGEPIEIACRQDVKPGTAYIRSNISGELKDYEIEIQKVDINAGHKNKSLVIKVVDPELLELTGGIVQGMSGSPVLQNGKLAGAVTHVFVQDAARGYGILAEDMIQH